MGFNSNGKGSKEQESKMIDELKPYFPLKNLLKYCEMPRSTYYEAKKEKKNKYEEYEALIKNIFEETNGTYGVCRMTDELKNRDKYLNHKTVKKLMRKLGLFGKVSKHGRYNSYKGDEGKKVNNILNRRFYADKPLTRLVTDVTQVKICGTWIYVSPILDLFNQEIIGYSVSRSANMKMIMEMLKCLDKITDFSDVLIHSDHGWQYQHQKYRDFLKSKGIKQSMSRKANVRDNTMIEVFFSIMKREMDDESSYKSVDEYLKALNEYIDFYNNKRIKHKLNGMSPVEYRKAFLSK